MDFFKITMSEVKSGPRKGEFDILPDFIVGRSKDLMVRGKSFYAIWDEERNLWSTDEYDVQRLVDEEMDRYVSDLKINVPFSVKYMRSYGSNSWNQFRKFLQNISDNSHDLDANLTFANMEVKKSDYVSRRLPYALGDGDHSAWDELLGTLYNIEERAKIEWAIGAVVAGDAKRIHKFLVFYGPTGTGKSTVLNIIQKLFEGYTTTFEAKALGSSSAAFSTEAFKDNPLVAIQHDGDLSRIEDNTKLNSIIAHEPMRMNEKYKPGYNSKVNAFLFMGTNQPVKITDAKSGIIRRLIDVNPTGVKIPINHYFALMGQIDFELGAIAYHCLEIYRKMGKNFYTTYSPLEMMLQTDVFFNFIEANFDVFKEQNDTTLSQAYALYREYCANTGIERPLAQYKVREELRNYFDAFYDRIQIGGERLRSYYSGFTARPFKAPKNDDITFSLVMDETESLFDEEFALLPAQGATSVETPLKRWASVRTTLADIDTSELHFVKVPEHHIVIDFDLKDENGSKSAERNLEAASRWPATYAELSKGGNGVHLHYIYDGDPGRLSGDYSDGIEVKVFTGNASLRRRLTKCNNVPIATIGSGLPLKEEKVISEKTIKSEQSLRNQIIKNLRKEIHPATKTSVDFIKKILDDAYDSDLVYDVSDLKPKIIAFANNSTNQALTSLKTVQEMQFKSKDADIPVDTGQTSESEALSFFDVEVFPNLFVVCWKYEDTPDGVKMINPTPQEVEALFKLKLVGYNNRRYDNHIIYARFLGYDNEQLYKLSQKIIGGNHAAMFGAAYDLSYTDIYDFASEKKTLKKHQIELGLNHKELDLPWDQPVPEDRIQDVADYCYNDVETEEAVFKDRIQDFVARQILADLSGLTVNHTTQQHTARIIFGDDRHPQADFNYTDLSREFPGYVYDKGVSTYRDEVTGEGGYVYAEPGIYTDVAVLDIASMHPTSIQQLNLFGPYTKNFVALKDARLAIKHKEFDIARKMLGSKLAPFLVSEDQAEALSYALKIVINIVYGLSSAKFDNPFRHSKNKDNIVAKRGALFMIDLKHFVQEQGFTVAHIKTDSIKIPNATFEIIEAVSNFGAKYGYTFEHENTYDKMCLVNDAVYIAKKRFNDNGEKTKWEAVGSQFQHPYVYKTLFSGDPVQFEDLCELRQVQKGAMYLDFDYDRPMVMPPEGMTFIGRAGQFVPVLEGSGGGILYRISEGKHYAIAGTKGYMWMEADVAKPMIEEIDIDMSYFEKLAKDAIDTINKFGDFEDFVN